MALAFQVLDSQVGTMPAQHLHGFSGPHAHMVIGLLAMLPEGFISFLFSRDGLYQLHTSLLLQVETREDEEQNVKLTEILELLVAAGYFRARIKGLSPFDKVRKSLASYYAISLKDCTINQGSGGWSDCVFTSSFSMILFLPIHIPQGCTQISCSKRIISQ